MSTGPNRSSAVMQQRKEPLDSLDDFPTPPWATRALIQHFFVLSAARNEGVLEPACGRGHMTRVLEEYFGLVTSFDVHDYGAGYPVDEFTLWRPQSEADKPDWIITNPPFRLGMDFALHALDNSRKGVALLLRTSFIEGKERYERLFRLNRPAIFAPFVERVAMVKGRLDRDASSATSYSWYIWHHGHIGNTHLEHIPPCRKDLERPDDYPDRD